MSGMNYKKSKRVLIISLVSFLLAQSIALAQTDSVKTKPINSLKDGAWALQFQIDRYFYLSDFQGSTISYKKHTSDRSAIRIGLTLSLSVGENERTGVRTSSNNVTSFSDDTDHNHQSIVLRMQKIWYGQPTRKLTVFYGFGPTVGFSRSELETLSLDGSGVQNFRARRDRAWTAGLTVVIGGEWFATDKISFLAEYGSELVYSWKKASQIDNRTGGVSPPRITETTIVSKSGSLYSIPVRFGLSIYF